MYDAGRAAARADRVHLLDLLGDRQELRHRAERLAAEVHVEAGDDDPLAEVGEVVADLRRSRRRRTAPRRCRPRRCAGRRGRRSRRRCARARPRGASGSATPPGRSRSGRRSPALNTCTRWRAMIARRRRRISSSDLPENMQPRHHLDPTAPGVPRVHQSLASLVLLAAFGPRATGRGPRFFATPFRGQTPASAQRSHAGVRARRRGGRAGSGGGRASTQTSRGNSAIRSRSIFSGSVAPGQAEAACESRATWVSTTTPAAIAERRPEHDVGGLAADAGERA